MLLLNRCNCLNESADIQLRFNFTVLIFLLLKPKYSNMTHYGMSFVNIMIVINLIATTMTHITAIIN